MVARKSRQYTRQERAAIVAEATSIGVYAAPPESREHRYRVAARRVLATFRAPHAERQRAVRVLAERLVPLT